MNPQHLGVLPVWAPAAAYAAGAGISALTVWFNPDIFIAMNLEADMEQRVAMLNNYWQNLSRSAGASGLVRGDSPVMRRLDGHMQGWWEFKQDFNEATITRMVPWYLGGRDWDDEYEVWLDIFKEDYIAVMEEGGERVRQEALARGLDPRVLPSDPSLATQLQDTIKSTQEALEGGAGQAGKGLFWPFVAVGSAGVIIAFLVTRKPRAAT